MITPVERYGDIWLKRDDLFRVAGVSGGKARTCWELARGADGLVTAGSRGSPQVNIVAHIGRTMRLPVRGHVPSGALHAEVSMAASCGASIVQHKPGYNTVLIARAKADAATLGWAYIPFGMECWEAVRQTSEQVGNLPGEALRLVVPVGSGMSLAGILHGLPADYSIPIVGVVVGANPVKRLDKYAPQGWRHRVQLVDSGVPYQRRATTQRFSAGGPLLDPIYEAKCLPFLKGGDVLWCVGMSRTEEVAS